MVRPPKNPSNIEGKTMKKTSAETWPEKHENIMKNDLKMESKNMKNPEKSGKMTYQKRGAKKVEKKVDPG